MSLASLVPRPEKGRRKGPGFHCLRMRLITVEFHRHRGRLIHVRTVDFTCFRTCVSVMEPRRRGFRLIPVRSVDDA